MGNDLSEFWAAARAWAVASEQSGCVTVELRSATGDKSVLRVPLNSVHLRDEATSFGREDWMMAFDGIDDGLTEGAGLGDVDELTCELFLEIARAVVERWMADAPPGRYRIRARDNKRGAGTAMGFHLPAESPASPPAEPAPLQERPLVTSDEANIVLAFSREQRRHVKEALDVSTGFSRNMAEVVGDAFRGSVSDMQLVYRAMINDQRQEYEAQLRHRDEELNRLRGRIDTLEAKNTKLEEDNRQTVAGSMEKVLELRGQQRDADAHASNVREFGQTIRQAMDGALDLGAVYVLKDKNFTVEEMGVVRLLSRSPELVSLLRHPSVKRLIDDPLFREICENDAARAQMLEGFKAMAAQGEAAAA